ncbi:efflux RND transporter permease subunit [Solihabitans fulvus]|uniref:Efflux RND transporter permease subunit n=1 Tax=Solihabitans fulvus TaxID=1892852 RepID=A0A5B2XWD8_9PSEU|nr:efflux RND transporter permease subunit [Solihabitans fulvus]KAA2267021.1 efflux RND transporter permease subunit [Solihabitans fulvus]
MRHLARISLANRALITLMSIGLLLFGLFAAGSLKQELLPSISQPSVTVTAVYPGAGPKIVERTVTEKIEQAVQGSQGQEKMTSLSRNGMAVVSLEYKFGTDIGKTTQDLQQKLSRIQSELPAGVTPSVGTQSIADIPAVYLAASADNDQDLAKKLQDTATAELKSIPGVSDAVVTGVRDQQVEVRLDRAKLAAAGLSVDGVEAALRTAGTPLPAGQVNEGANAFPIQVGGTFNTLADVQNFLLTPDPMALAAAGADRAAAPKPVTLGEVADVKQVLAESTSLTRTDGKPSLGLAVMTGQDGNVVSISDAVKAKLPDLAKKLGGGAAFTVVFDQAPFIQSSIKDLTTEGLLGLLFAALVILIFLLSLRSTLVTLVSIPLSLLVALIGLWVGGMSLNLLTLGGLTIAIGRVVDDSIVVIENIKRHLSQGKEKRSAVLDAVREVSGAVTASTLTTVAVFLPIAFTSGLVGQLFSAFSLTVTIALIASLLVSLTVVPVLAFWFLKAPKPGAQAAETRRDESGFLQRAYLPVIGFAVRKRKTVLAIGLLLLIGTFGVLLPMVKTNFLDQSGQDTFTAKQELPPGTNLTTTDEAAKKVETVLRAVPGVKSYQVTVGGGGVASGGGDSGTNTADYYVTAKPGVDVKTVQQQVRDATAKLSDVGKVTVAEGQQGGLGGSGVAVTVSAQDEATLATAADQVTKAVQGAPNAGEVTSGLAKAADEITIRVDQRKAAALGLSEAQVGRVISRITRSDKVAKLNVDGKQQDITVRDATTLADTTALRQLPVSSAGGQTVRLEQIAEIVKAPAQTQINRIDGKMATTVTAKTTDKDLGAVSKDITKRVGDLTLPAGATATLGGVSQQQSDSFSSLGLAMLAAILIVYLIMVGTFRSLVQPLILLVSIPFAATGGIGLLLLTDTPLGLASMIGALMLVGIVVTNAIVLLDLIRQYREQGMSVRDAVVEGCRHRLRPVLMTAVATICALTPMALGITGGGGFISKPLAVIVIGGLITSTILTLVLIPTLYTMTEGVKERRKARRGKVEDAVEPELATTSA